MRFLVDKRTTLDDLTDFINKTTDGTSYIHAKKDENTGVITLFTRKESFSSNEVTHKGSKVTCFDAARKAIKIALRNYAHKNFHGLTNIAIDAVIDKLLTNGEKLELNSIKQLIKDSKKGLQEASDAVVSNLKSNLKKVLNNKNSIQKDIITLTEKFSTDLVQYFCVNNTTEEALKLMEEDGKAIKSSIRNAIKKKFGVGSDDLFEPLKNFVDKVYEDAIESYKTKFKKKILFGKENWHNNAIQSAFQADEALNPGWKRITIPPVAERTSSGIQGFLELIPPNAKTAIIKHGEERIVLRKKDPTGDSKNPSSWEVSWNGESYGVLTEKRFNRNIKDHVDHHNSNAPAQQTQQNSTTHKNDNSAHNKQPDNVKSIKNSKYQLAENCATTGDGNCLLHACFGNRKNDLWTLDETDVKARRQQLVEALRKILNGDQKKDLDSLICQYLDEAKIALMKVSVENRDALLASFGNGPLREELTKWSQQTAKYAEFQNASCSEFIKQKFNNDDKNYKKFMNALRDKFNLKETDNDDDIVRIAVHTLNGNTVELLNPLKRLKNVEKIENIPQHAEMKELFETHNLDISDFTQAMLSAEMLENIRDNNLEENLINAFLDFYNRDKVYLNRDFIPVIAQTFRKPIGIVDNNDSIKIYAEDGKLVQDTNQVPKDIVYIRFDGNNRHFSRIEPRNNIQKIGEIGVNSENTTPKDNLEQRIANVKNISDENELITELNDIARNMGMRHTQNIPLWEKFLEVIKSIKEERVLNSVFDMVIHGFSHGLKSNESIHLWKSLIKIAEKIKGEEYRDYALEQVMWGITQTKINEISFLESLPKYVKKIKNEVRQNAAFGHVGTIMGNAKIKNIDLWKSLIEDVKDSPAIGGVAAGMGVAEITDIGLWKSIIESVNIDNRDDLWLSNVVPKVAQGMSHAKIQNKEFEESLKKVTEKRNLQHLLEVSVT